MRTNCSLQLTDVKMAVEDGCAMASAEIFASVSVLADKRQRSLSASYITDEEYISDDSVVTVYYPDTQESLFDIAKKFHTSVGAIAQSNRLTETVFASSSKPLATCGVTKLLIE